MSAWGKPVAKALTPRETKLVERARENGGWSAQHVANLLQVDVDAVRRIFAEAGR